LDLFFAGIAQIAMCDGLGALPDLERPGPPIWSTIAHDPTAFLELRLCSVDWFERCIGALVEAEEHVDLTGRSLIHGDIRSDNVCLAGSRAVFVDWSSAARGNGTYNLASVLASIHLEGGPSPYDVMPDGAGWAALDSASLAQRAIQDQATPAWLQRVFKRLIVINLEWAANALGLPAPGGPKWNEV
ncbi:MAG: phosphotransferase, partial [Dehalococcoidia bacterium]